MPIYEVFKQEKDGDPMVHGGSVVAPNSDLAINYAREFYSRRGESMRLWVVDHDGVEWVSMPRAKADTYAIDGAKLERLRGGEKRCVVPRIVDDPIANRRTFDLRQEKYAVQRLGGMLGMFGDGPSPETITLRFDSCD